jgi:DNA polymerase-4/DNA polymerase V
MREKFGKHCLHLGAAHPIDALGKGRRGTPTVREQTTFFGETKRKHLPLPVLHVKV